MVHKIERVRVIKTYKLTHKISFITHLYIGEVGIIDEYPQHMFCGAYNIDEVRGSDEYQYRFMAHNIKSD